MNEPDMKKLNEIMADALSECRNRWDREKILLDHIKAEVDNHKIPVFMYKRHKEGPILLRPVIDTISRYKRAGSLTGKPGILIGSTFYRLNEGRLLRRLDWKSFDKVRSIEKEIDRLNTEKQKILKDAWTRNKKLTWQFMYEWDQERKKLFQSFGVD